jgi:geranylgeranyl diphosphate synthase type II
MDSFTVYKEKINRYLAREGFRDSPENLYQPVAYTLNLGGKRLRPVLALAACELFGGDVDSALPAAAGLEIFHNFTLLHDDIMDKALQRRGKTSVFKKWNANIAILSGDTMFALAYRYFLSGDYENLRTLLSVFTHTAIEVCEGQQYDMDFEDRGDVTIAEYLKMIKLKTAVLLGASLKIGALIAGADGTQAELLYHFGVNAGMAFQLKDDWLDAFGEEDKFGKTIGGDILADKKTYLYLRCLEKATPADKNILLRLYSSETPEEQGKIKKVTQLFDKYDIQNETIHVMESYFNSALDFLDRVNAPSGGKDELARFAAWLYRRDH